MRCQKRLVALLGTFAVSFIAYFVFVNQQLSPLAVRHSLSQGYVLEKPTSKPVPEEAVVEPTQLQQEGRHLEETIDAQDSPKDTLSRALTDIMHEDLDAGSSDWFRWYLGTVEGLPPVTAMVPSLQDLSSWFSVPNRSRTLSEYSYSPPRGAIVTLGTYWPSVSRYARTRHHQVIALLSWLLIPRTRVVVFTSDPFAKRVASSLGATVISKFERNPAGSPFVRSMLEGLLLEANATEFVGLIHPHLVLGDELSDTLDAIGAAQTASQRAKEPGTGPSQSTLSVLQRFETDGPRSGFERILFSGSLGVSSMAEVDLLAEYVGTTPLEPEDNETQKAVAKAREAVQRNRATSAVAAGRNRFNEMLDAVAAMACLFRDDVHDLLILSTHVVRRPAATEVPAQGEDRSTEKNGGGDGSPRSGEEDAGAGEDERSARSNGDEENEQKEDARNLRRTQTRQAPSLPAVSSALVSRWLKNLPDCVFLRPGWDNIVTQWATDRSGGLRQREVVDISRTVIGLRPPIDTHNPENDVWEDILWNMNLGDSNAASGGRKKYDPNARMPAADAMWASVRTDAVPLERRQAIVDAAIKQVSDTAMKEMRRSSPPGEREEKEKGKRGGGKESSRSSSTPDLEALARYDAALVEELVEATSENAMGAQLAARARGRQAVWGSGAVQLRLATSVRPQFGIPAAQCRKKRSAPKIIEDSATQQGAGSSSGGTSTSRAGMTLLERRRAAAQRAKERRDQLLRLREEARQKQEARKQEEQDRKAREREEREEREQPKQRDEEPTERGLKEGEDDDGGANGQDRDGETVNDDGEGVAQGNDDAAPQQRRKLMDPSDIDADAGEAMSKSNKRQSEDEEEADAEAEEEIERIEGEYQEGNDSKYDNE